MVLIDTPVCDFGWQAPDFTLKDAHGNNHNMSACLGEKGLLVMFICNHCPYVKRIAESLSHDCKTLMDEGVGVLAVMSNDYKNYTDDSPENMLEFAKQHSFIFPYLIDEDQVVAKTYQAVCTPDFFGLNSKGKLQYRGRFDNTRMDNSVERKPELLNAMRQIAETDSGPKHQVASMGCSIKWK